MTFTNPALWIGATALAVPLLVHLLTRRARRVLTFPTVRFLEAARASQSSLYRLRHWIMFLLRMALIGLVLLAFLKPVQQNHTLAQPLPDQAAANAVIIVLDASASMGWTGRGFSPFARGRRAAEKILDDLAAGDLANVILAAAAPQPSFAEPASNRFHLRQDLATAVATVERADLDAALAEAVAQLGKLPRHRKEIHLLSDFQRSNWGAVNFASVPPEVQLVFVSVADRAPENAAITEVSVQPPTAAVAEEVDITCKIANYGPQPRQLAVQLALGDAPPLRRDLSLAAGATATAGFRVRPRASGLFEGELSIPDDGLLADNRRCFTLSVAERLQVVIVSDDPRHDPAAAHRFLLRAINPFAGGERSVFTTEVTTADGFDRFAASRAHLLVLAGLRELPEATGRVLIEYLQNGGGVLWFLGSPADRANLAMLEQLAGAETKFPFTVGDRMDTGEAFARVTEANFDDPLLRPFREDGALGEIRFSRFFTTERRPGQGQVLLRFDDRHVALARRSVGLGVLVLANFSPALRDSDLAKRPVFVPFVHELLKALRPQSGGERAGVVGGPAATTIQLASADEELGFLNPAGEPISAVVERNAGEAAVMFPKTKACGFYRVRADGRPRGAVAVNLDARESNLEALTSEQVQVLASREPGRSFSSAGSDLTALQHLREGKPLWHWFLLGALGVLGVEQLLALVWRR